MFAPHVYPNVLVRGAARAPRFRDGLANHLRAVLWLEKAPRDAALELVLVSPEEMAGVSCRGRGIDAPTDVLTFSQSDPMSALVNEMCFGDDGSASPLASVWDADARADIVDLGVVYMCVPYMWHRCAVAPTKNLPFSLYLHAAVVHAALHALGYDHETPEELQAMVRREQQMGRQLRGLARRYPALLPPLDGLEYLRHTWRP